MSATKLGLPYNPTSKTVQLAFPVSGQAPATWVDGTWETTPSQYLARALVGPGGAIQLDPGTYDVYVKITDDPEIPVVAAQGELEVSPF